MWSAIAVRSASKPVPHTIFSALPPVDLGTATTTTPTWRDRSKLSQKHTTHANKHADLRLPDSPTPCKVTLPMLCHGPRCVAGDTHARARHCNPPFHAPSSVRLHVHGEPNNRHMVTVLPPPAGSPPRMARTWRAQQSANHSTSDTCQLAVVVQWWCLHGFQCLHCTMPAGAPRGILDTVRRCSVLFSPNTCGWRKPLCRSQPTDGKQTTTLRDRRIGSGNRFCHSQANLHRVCTHHDSPLRSISKSDHDRAPLNNKRTSCEQLRTCGGGCALDHVWKQAQGAAEECTRAQALNHPWPRYIVLEVTILNVCQERL